MTTLCLDDLSEPTRSSVVAIHHTRAAKSRAVHEAVMLDGERQHLPPSEYLPLAAQAASDVRAGKSSPARAIALAHRALKRMRRLGGDAA